MDQLEQRQRLEESVNRIIKTVPITDIHTHLFSESFDGLFLYGIDELLTYHYLVAEAMRHIDFSYDSFFGLDKIRQAELVWDVLFVKNTPVSEPARSVITIFNKLGLDVNCKKLDYYRKFFESQTLSHHIDRVFDITGIQSVVMTNDPLDQKERAIWENGYKSDVRFKASLRLDRLLNSWGEGVVLLKGLGYDVQEDITQTTIDEVKRFIVDWIDRTKSLYCAVSLPPDFKMEDGSRRAELIEKCILPVCRTRNIPFALMIGVKRAVNPQLGLAGDSLGKTDISSVEYLCSRYPKNKFMVTVLSLENQHELAVTARKFRNLMIFGCWWYLNTPSLIEHITNIRMEWLGMSFIPQHSDCRVFEQLISKWEHSKTVIARVLINKYSDLAHEGYSISNTEEIIQRDIIKLFGGNFWSFVNREWSI